LTKEEDAEEALLITRLSALAAGPENQARVRGKELERRRRVSLGGGPPLSLAEESELRGLTTLYPKMLPRRSEEIILFDSAFNDARYRTRYLTGSLRRRPFIALLDNFIILSAF
jgi:hypothetical protein